MSALTWEGRTGSDNAELWVLAPFEDEHGNKFPMMVHATELGAKAAQRPGEPDPVRYVPAVEQAYAVPATTLDADLLSAQQDCTCLKRWNGHTHECGARVVKRMLAHKVAAETGKAQAEWTVCRHGYMPPAGEKVLFWCRGWLKGATPGLGMYNGDFWEDETQTDNDGCFKLIPGSEVTHWTPLPNSPPLAPEGT
jgi:hypothetical protein